MRSRSLGKFLALFVLNFAFFSSSLPAKETIQVSLDGRSEKVALQIDPLLKKVLAKFRSWEEILAPEIDVEFMLSAGELRRAILGIPTSGPGDFEVFLQFRNKNLYPHTYLRTISLLKAKGINIEAELRELLGDQSKVIDIFARDQKGIEMNSPFATDKGIFWGRGDTSINELIYSPRRNLIFGAAENLEALANGKIEYLELAKIQRHDEPKSIPHVAPDRKPSDKKEPDNHTSYYPATTIRQDFRMTRLEIDLLLLSANQNPNKLELAESFIEPLRGTELFFSEVPDEDIPKFRLYTDDDAYVQNFLKIFRNRTDQQLARIRQYLKSNYQRKWELWKLMGLDVDLLTAPRSNVKDIAALEFRAVFQNARYDNIRTLVDKTKMRVRNPFRYKTHLRRLLSDFPKLDPVFAKQQDVIPLEVLRLYSPKLYAGALYFDDLTLERQVRTITQFRAALDLLLGPAFKRLNENVDFRNNHSHKFPFIDPSAVTEDDPRTLLEVIVDQMPENHRDVSYVNDKSWPYNDYAIGRIFAEATQAKRQQKIPALVVDLDNTVFESSSRTLHLLQEYDILNGTHWFDDLSFEAIPPSQFSEFFYAHLVDQTSSSDELEELVEEIEAFIDINRWDPSFVERDEMNSEMVSFLRTAQMRGIEIFYLTAREESLREATKRALRRVGLPDQNLIMKPKKLRQRDAPWKEDIMDWLASDFETHKFIGFIDDNQTIVNRISSWAEDTSIDDGKGNVTFEMPVFRAVIRHQGMMSHLFMVGDLADLYDIHTQCGAHLASQAPSQK